MRDKFIVAMLLGLALIFLAGQFAYAAPARVTAKPVEDKKITIYAYKSGSMVTLDDAKPGFLIEVVKTIVAHPSLPVETEVVPVNVLMKYSLIQSVGVAAIGMDKDFSSKELEHLMGIPLYEKDGKTYKLFFNELNPQGEPLYKDTRKRLEQIKADGTLNQLKKQYSLD